MSASARLLPDGVKIECEDSSVSLRLNSEGYWCSARFDGEFYRRCLDGEVIASVSGESIPEMACQEICERVRTFCIDSQGADFCLKGSTADSVEKASRLSFEHYKNQSRLYQKVYPESVPVLPPDRYRDLVVPLTTGCPNGKCTFCAFYRDKPFRVLSDDELQQRLSDILSLVPSGVAGRQGIFLGSANALAIPVSRLVSLLNVIDKRLGKSEKGVACFGDADFMGRRTSQDWKQLYASGLSQVVIGLESGYADLRSRLGKSANLEKTRQLVSELKNTGIRVGLTVLTGVCDKESLNEHFLATQAFLQSLNLDAEDKTYISPWFSDGDQPSLRAFEEAEELKALLKTTIHARVTLYSSHNFHYFS
ncbi:hypothetical protein M3P05_15595 [Sansalvadorimonas sp. 2012CJ34-2]|uniref:Elp3/MiaA/NifB-like radical SAM core domain-containing protein n=1 Tax=Parendozoicomonas callyspongiae TaxID=2942213 RepID=A0ABT0PIY7_9GAMM|nr:radical SAM protein [Sansalvadorimonas sp. 2012CJ34-2]MCL6271344.1 hypothetical protein [Sansalvadorimonas sp. 2012CJ34-2]